MVHVLWKEDDVLHSECKNYMLFVCYTIVPQYLPVNARSLDVCSWTAFVLYTRLHKYKPVCGRSLDGHTFVSCIWLVRSCPVTGTLPHSLCSVYCNRMLESRPASRTQYQEQGRWCAGLRLARSIRIRDDGVQACFRHAVLGAGTMEHMNLIE